MGAITGKTRICNGLQKKKKKEKTITKDQMIFYEKKIPPKFVG